MPFNDPTPDHISRLEPRTAALAFELINAARIGGIPLYISSSRRTYGEQARLVRAGRSRTMKSKHLEGEAFDVDVLGYTRDQLSREFWQMLGAYGKWLGLFWGGDFKGFYDAGHFELM